MNDDYSTNPNDRLSFSVDTLSFDTVFTTVGSATRQFMIYNRNTDPLNIESVQLASSSTSGFRLNVDGRSGESFSDIRILGKDSMYVFVEVTVDPTGHVEPLLLEDRVEFTTNGVKQTVLLQAYGQDANMIKGGYTFTTDTLLTAERPYLIYDSVVVAEGVTLKIEEGTTFYMHDKAKWQVFGTMQATGTLEKPVVFRGDRLDDILTDLPYDRMPGQWGGIYLKKESFNNTLDYVIVRNATHAMVLESSEPTQPKLTIRNSQITNAQESLFVAQNCQVEAINTEFTNAAKSIVSLVGGSYHFIHCTLANYFIISPGRRGQPVLALTNYIIGADKETIIYPLQKATFDNCIIDGSYPEGDKPLGGEISVDNAEGTEINFLFNHCAVKTKEAEVSVFVGVQFIDKDNKLSYKSLGSSDNDYVFDYRLNISQDEDGNVLEKQLAVGKADRSVSELYPLDRYGLDRLASEDGPDIGAYEYVPDPEEE
ncbi:hypothetical protein M2459_002202 [Parabacteroides sp. PF5-5]|uniref:hypothetical protein n=1 Tax=unclassified Parabacteroides TaxID=2649774 RepID=UPI0024768621|nr:MULTISPECIES: hypothetical protein [unclassified Parabacteroides]MDH6305105.1 hypothetical protein [Parabacteroides sp. PH5-39]MDH6316455.1 hypothetical protein [Parabacteroides sp. PF5-13]MDH6319965.1 hypothetical protein [Parabacteroides sp. PH5-13]MDH6323802.1 hypothetical protein [Parabacteroides sp. PH5-8]MDH6327642.1 hypothetical protein [Parabacteroides sp. PH5-41]